MKITPVSSVVAPAISPEGVQRPTNVDRARMMMQTNRTPLTGAPDLSISQLSETPTEPAIEATEPLSPQLAQLAKQRRAVQREMALLAREKARMSQSPSAGEGAIDLARLKAEPLSVLLESGVTYDQLTEAILANQQNSGLSALQQKIQALEQGIDQKFADRESQSEKKVMTQMRRDAELLARGDQYELVRETGNIRTVMELIQRTYTKTGELLDVEEALRLVETELLTDAQKMMKFKKLQAQMAPPPMPAPPQRQQHVMRTLTNRDTAAAPMSAKQRAIAAFYGNLKR